MSEVSAAVERFLVTHAVSSSASPVVIPTASRQDLCDLFAALGYRFGAEIGVWAGLFSEEICRANPELQLTCVDPWLQYSAYKERKNNQERLDEAYAETCVRLAPFGCRILRMTSVAAAAIIPNASLDFVYIDGNHSLVSVTQDLDAWVPKVRSGGIVSGHDYEIVKRSRWIEAREAVDVFTRTHRISPWYVLSAEKAPSYFWVVP